MQWIEGVLKIAKVSGWSFPRGCASESLRRRIILARLRARGSPILRISECCAGGKIFFVDIPSETPGGDWSSFLTKVQEQIGLAVPASKVVQGRSFAEVVGKRGLALNGRCSVETEAGVPRVVASEEGIAERIKFLEKCLLFRFVGKEEVIWPDFRRWASRQWGIPESSVFLPVGDDIWLLECASRAAVERIIALKRFRFGSLQIFLDVWIKDASRSNVLQDSMTSWVVVKDIPLHLRSWDLARCLGEAMGGFLAVSDGVDLSSLRIKVRARVLAPAVIPISVGSDLFPVRAFPEVGLLATPDKREKGKGVAFSHPSVSSAPVVWSASESLFADEECFSVGESSDSVRCPLPEAPSTSVLPMGPQQDRQLMATEDNFWKGSNLLSVDVASAEFDRRAFLNNDVKESTFVGFSLTSAGLRIGIRRFILDEAVFKKAPRLDFSGSYFGEAHMFCSLATSSNFGFGPNVGLSNSPMGPLFVSKPSSGLAEVKELAGSFPSLTPEAKFPLSSPVPPARQSAVLENLPQLSEQVHTVYQAPISDALGSDLIGLGQEEKEQKELQEESLMLDAVQKVAEVIHLELDGSLALGVGEALELCKESRRRRAPAVPLTWSERELKRLGASPEVTTSRRKSKRVERCASSSTPSDEF
ncbi:hypothetical protein LINPERHAP1_LOCUS15580 [Linum perenne]